MEVNNLEEFEKDSRLQEFDIRIGRFNKVGWSCVGIGFLVALFGIVKLQGSLSLHEFGDFIGGTTASLWSLAGLVFIYVAFLGQQKQMHLQKIEMRLTRNEFAAQSAELRKQNESLTMQNFENTFFRLISLYKESLRDWKGTRITKKNGKETLRKEIIGLENLNNLFKEIDPRYKSFRKKMIGEREAIISAFEDLEARGGGFLLNEVYFIQIGSILKFISSPSGEINKDKYFTLFFSMLSREELLMYRHFVLYKGEFNLLKILHEKAVCQM